MSVEVEYHARVDAMGVIDRIRRADELFNWARDYLTRSILAARGPLPDGQLKLEVALLLYGADPAFKALIDELRTRVAR